MDGMSRTILEAVLSLPTMSFHETAVSTFVRWYCTGLGLPVVEDAGGNLIVRYNGGGESMTLTAHMDHPGFEVIAAKGRAGKVALWGKVDTKVFADAKVIVETADGSVKAQIGKGLLREQHLGRPTFAIKAQRELGVGDFGAYDLPKVSFASDKIKATACDNLVSVAVILDLLTRFSKGSAGVGLTALFTRGEEAGFLGAFAAMEEGSIPKSDPLIVLECSSAKGGNVGIGGGPVVRAGDLQSTYDPAMDVWISDVARSIASTDKTFAWQRALLQGGRCEACVYVAEGYITGGIAMPLGNYHNHGPKGYASECVSQADYANYLKLLAALAHRPAERSAMRDKVAPIWKHYRGLKKKLCESR
jgi:endoglucanase